MICNRSFEIFRHITIACAFTERWMVPHRMRSRSQRNIGSFASTTTDGKATAGAFISYRRRRDD